ncbi:MAG: xanthine dehydrogenase accessory protein XdhC [Bdellovibrio sp.]
MIEEKVLELKSRNIPFVIITLIDIKGSAPQELGAKALVTQNGLEYGTIGGGKVEASAIELALEIMRDQDSKTIITRKWNLQKDIKMTCGGEVTLLFEKHAPPLFQVTIFGAGHVAQELIHILSRTSCYITVVDDRKEWIERIPKKHNIQVFCSNEIEKIVKGLNPENFFVCMTKGHATDLPFLIELSKYHSQAKYIGVIGSQSKRNAIFKELSSIVDPQFIERIKMPIGLPIGDNTPPEIAISIAAELIQVRDNN